MLRRVLSNKPFGSGAFGGGQSSVHTPPENPASCAL